MRRSVHLAFYGGFRVLRGVDCSLQGPELEFARYANRSLVPPHQRRSSLEDASSETPPLFFFNIRNDALVFSFSFSETPRFLLVSFETTPVLLSWPVFFFISLSSARQCRLSTCRVSWSHPHRRRRRRCRSAVAPRAVARHVSLVFLFFCSLVFLFSCLLVLLYSCSLVLLYSCLLVLLFSCTLCSRFDSVGGVGEEGPSASVPEICERPDEEQDEENLVPEAINTISFNQEITSTLKRAPDRDGVYVCTMCATDLAMCVHVLVCISLDCVHAPYARSHVSLLLFLSCFFMVFCAPHRTQRAPAVA